MAKYIKNDSGVTDTWTGQELTNGQILELNPDDDTRFQAEAKTASSKVETDVLSGDLKVSLDNFATTLSAADGLAYLKDSNAGCIQGVLVDDSAKADGYALKYDSASDKIIYGPAAAGASDMPGLQMKRTTDDALSTTEANVTFDLTPFENDVATIEHNNTNTDRMDIKQTGAYLLGINLNCENTANISKTLTLRLRIDDTTTAATLVFNISKGSNEVFSRTIPVSLTAGTYVTIDAKGDTASDLILKADSVMWAVRLSGKTGATGPQGAAGTNGTNGADGDITWQGNWVSQNYTANQAVKYTDGNSYVCKLDTVSSEVPTNATYWDVLAEKGDTGAAGTGQNRIDISVHPHNDDKKGTASATYVSQARFLWAGSTLLGTPTKIYANSFQISAGNGQVRIYDATNAQVIAESASITSTSEGNIVDLGTISNISTGQAVWKIENKGDGTNVNDIAAVSVEF